MAKEKTKTKADEAAEMILEQIRVGTAPWQRNWTPGTIHLNHNAATGANYKGYNQILLMQYQDMAGYSDPRWLTYRQAQDAGAQVKGAQSGWPLMKFTFEDRKKKITAEDAAKIYRITGWDQEGFGLGARGRVTSIWTTEFGLDATMHQLVTDGLAKEFITRGQTDAETVEWDQ